MKIFYLFISSLCVSVHFIHASSSDESGTQSRQGSTADVTAMEIDSERPRLSKKVRHLSIEIDRKGQKVSSSGFPSHDDNSGTTLNRSTSLQMRKPSIFSRTNSQNKNKEGELINASLNNIENKLKHTLTFKKSGKTLRKNKAFNNRDYEDWQKNVAFYKKEGKRKDKQVTNPFDFKKQQQRRKESREHLFIPSRESKLKSNKLYSPTSSGYSSGTSSGSNRSRSSSRSNPSSPLSHKKEERRIYLERPMEKAEEQRKLIRSGVCIKPGCDHKNAKCNRRTRGKC